MDTIKNVHVLFFEGYTVLDVFGPIQAYVSSVKLPEKSQLFTVYGVGQKHSIIKTTKDQQIPGVEICVSFEDIIKKDIHPDVFIIPGGFGTRKEVNNKELIEGIKMIAQRSKIVASVCTGAGLLAKTGLLDGLEATSNKLAWEWVIAQSDKVIWKRKARWVEHIDLEKKTGIITSAGVSAGIDMTLRVIEILFGKDVAQYGAKAMEYVWNTDKDNDPFG